MTIIRQKTILCPQCEGEMAIFVGVSGNTFGSTLWTDGFLDAPMLQPAARALRCPHCHEAFFRDDAKEAEEHSTARPEIASDSTPYASVGGLSTYRELIAKTTDRERLGYLRIMIWHEQNDRLRKEHAKREREKRNAWPDLRSRSETADGAQRLEPAAPIKNARFAANLRALSKLLDETPEHAIMKAEICRELGMFEQAIDTAGAVSGKSEWVAHQIIALAKAGNARVAILKRPGEKED